VLIRISAKVGCDETLSFSISQNLILLFQRLVYFFHRLIFVPCTGNCVKSDLF